MKKWLGSLTIVAATAVGSPIGHAETPASTLVIAMNIDDIISLDPAETFELVGGEINANVYGYRQVAAGGLAVAGLAG